MMVARTLRWSAVAIVGVALAALSWHEWAGAAGVHKLKYDGSGYGTYRRADSQWHAAPAVPGHTVGGGALARGSAEARADAETQVVSAASAYEHGQYEEVESIAAQMDREVSRLSRASAEQKKAQARVDLIAAYAEARQKNMERAREEFGKVQEECAKLPDHGARRREVGVSKPTIEEEAAYRHAVCTAALGERVEAKAEYEQFMRDFPVSPLIHGAIKRITWLNGGVIPRDSEDVWKAAMREAAKREKAHKRGESLCGPECMARAFGGHGSVSALADEMGTTDDGTTLGAMAAAARRRGIEASGEQMTLSDLAAAMAKSRTVVALVNPGHYVLVENASLDSVRIWDPDLRAVGRGGTRSYSAADWSRVWNGVGLVMR